MPPTTTPQASPDITVTSNTQTEEQVRKELGVDETPKTPDPSGAHTDEEQAAAAEAAEVEQELDKVEPPVANETPQQKVARQSRATKKVLKEIGLRKQAEDKLAAVERELQTLRTAPPAAPKPATPPPAKAADAPPADGTKTAPTFEFPTFEDYQEQHPDADLRDYTIALTDARTEFTSARARERADSDALAASERELTATHKTAEAEFRAAHPDYTEKLKNVVLPPDIRPGVRDPLVADLEALVLQAGKDGPGILYYLGNNPAEVTRLTSVPSRTQLAVTFGEIRYAARTSQTAAPAGGPPSRPVTRAPAPVTPTPAEHKSARSLKEIADEDEDADAYIAEVKRLSKAG